MNKLSPLFLVCILSARAELVWENTEISLKPDPGTKAIEAQFTFVNRSKVPVVITNVSASCGCTAAQPDKRNYAPNEKGLIKASFNPSGMFGRQEKTITVNTDEPGSGDQQLKLIVELPDAYTLSPRLLSWSVGSDSTTKSVRFQKNAALKWPLPRLHAIPAGFQAELVPIKEDSNTVEIRIRPDDTNEAREGRLTLNLATGGVDEDGLPKMQRLQIVLAVR